MFIYQDRIRYDEEWHNSCWLNIDKIVSIVPAKEEDRYFVFMVNDTSDYSYVIDQETFDKIMAEKGMI